MSPASIYEYGKTIKWTIDAIGNLEVCKINEEHITELKKGYNKKELKPATKAHNLSVIKELLRFCQNELHLQVMDFEKIRRPTIPRRRVEYLTEEELKHFFNSIPKKSIRDFRFRAFVSVLISTGCRISEALNLKIQEIDWTKKEVMDEAKKLGAVDFIVKSETTPKTVAQRVKELVAEDKASEKA